MLFFVLVVLGIRFFMLALNPYPDTTANTQYMQYASSIPDFYENLSMLESSRISLISPRSAAAIVKDIAAEGIGLGYTPESLAAILIPSSGYILAMLIDDGDSEEYQNLDGLSYPARLYYDRIASLHPTMDTLRSRYESVFDSLYESLKDSAPSLPLEWLEKDWEAWQGDITLPHLFTLPRLQDLDYSHTFALDIFLKNVEYLPGDVQRGPMIYSLSDGIVVASEGGWVGFPRKSEPLSFIEGGISPKSGNGVIVYSPDERRYYLYFHLYDVLVGKGQIIRRGQVLGHAGNTGINARKKGGGDHLHLEIFDARSGKSFRNTEIIALLKDSSREGPAVSSE
jgi:murein DD-endopeptidase MepM/ murein hydrolase activator NlpD